MEKMNQIQEFWQRTDRLLKDRGLTYVQLCKQSGINMNTLYNQRSRNHYPAVPDLIKIAETLDTAVDWMLIGKVRQENLSNSEYDSINIYLNANVEVKAIVDRILRGLK